VCVEVIVKTKSILIFFCLVGGVPFAALGEQKAPPIASNAATLSVGLPARLVPVRQAFDAAWQRAVQRGEAEGLAARSKTEQGIATNFLAGPPSIEFSQRTDRWHAAKGSRENEVGLSMPIGLPGQRGARIASSDVGLRVAEAAMASSRLRVAGEVREAAWAISAQNAELGIAEEQAAYLKQLAADVLRRVDAGDLARSDWLAAEAESLAAASAVLETRARLNMGLSQWKLLTGLNALPDPNESSLIKTVAASTHPESDLAMFSQDRAKRQADLAAMSRWDSPELSLQFREDIPATGIPAQRSVGISIRIPLGASERGLAQLAEARSNRTVAELHNLREQERIAADVMNAKLAVEMAQQGLAAEQLRASRLTERAGLIEKSFKLGESPLADLLRAKSGATQAIASRAKQEAAAGLAAARLKQAIGELP
jgi:outer membrane protein, heavy metal efflux system